MESLVFVELRSHRRPIDRSARISRAKRRGRWEEVEKRRRKRKEKRENAKERRRNERKNEGSEARGTPRGSRGRRRKGTQDTRWCSRAPSTEPPLGESSTLAPARTGSSDAIAVVAVDQPSGNRNRNRVLSSLDSRATPLLVLLDAKVRYIVEDKNDR